MDKLSSLCPEKVFDYFEQISSVPRGSGNTAPIADFAVSFAKSHSLRYYRDDADNVVIYKDASKGYENSPSVILQGHLDMVCQKTADSDFDFLKDKIRLAVDGDLIKADGTTLGADNGIAVAMALAILEDNTLSHPAIEAVFTSNEEIGMLGAAALDMNSLSSKLMINLDSEEDDTITVSCAGGIDFHAKIPIERKTVRGTEVVVSLSGLRGGHSGIDIDRGRINAAVLSGQFLNYIRQYHNCDIINISSGNKANAIPKAFNITLATDNPNEFIKDSGNYLSQALSEVLENSSSVSYDITVGKEDDFEVFSDKTADSLMFVLAHAPNGVIKKSEEIQGLVETSLNLGILETKAADIYIQYALRSSKEDALWSLVNSLHSCFESARLKGETSGYYPPWEYKNDSRLRELYCEVYKQQVGERPIVSAIHAGLECAVFSSKIKGLDCISVGPTMFDVHTTDERLSIKSVGRVYSILTELLKRLKPRS